jgi:small redox-active disulfide protein 2
MSVTCSWIIEEICMKKIQIAGSGCPKCQKLAELVETAAKMMNIDYELKKVTDIQHILALGILLTPAMIVDGVVKVSGRLPSLDEIKKHLV